jgi:hypothetical protein
MHHWQENSDHIGDARARQDETVTTTQSREYLNLVGKRVQLIETDTHDNREHDHVGV